MGSTGRSEGRDTPGHKLKGHGPVRYMEDNAFVSRADPPIRIRIDRAFEYVGHVDFDLTGNGGVARLDLHVLVDAKQGRVERMMILHFEELVGPGRSFSERTANPVALGGETYQQNTYFFRVSQDIEGRPEGEIARVKALLESRGCALEDEMMTSGFVRIAGSERRNEFIIFYYENVSSTGFGLGEISEGGGIRPEYAGLSTSLTDRSLRSFSVQS